MKDAAFCEMDMERAEKVLMNIICNIDAAKCRIIEGKGDAAIAELNECSDYIRKIFSIIRDKRKSEPTMKDEYRDGL